MSVEFDSIQTLREALDNKAISATELTKHFLSRIDQLDPSLNSYITVEHERALSTAAAIDKKLLAGERAPLLGIPIAEKDIFCTEGVRTTAGSKMLAEYRPPFDSTATANLAAAGVIRLGKCNLDEFAMGSSNENSYFGAVKNPWNQERVPGGSSGGSAAAVAGGLCVAATGTDTGGSIRQPSAFCGLTGIKPTYGRVSRWGMIAFASSLDQAGPMARSAADAALLLEAMAGPDEKDSSCLTVPVDPYSTLIRQPLEGMRIGIVPSLLAEGLSESIAEAFEDCRKGLEKLGATFVEIELMHHHHSVGAYYVIAPAEASANLARYDGVRFGYRCEDPADLQDLYLRSRNEGFGDEVKRRILVGTFALSAGYYDAYYKQAQRVRRLIQGDFLQAFDQVDMILTPTTPTTAFSLGENTEDPVAMYLQDIYTISANLAGLPAISFPAGMSLGLPIGLQLVGPHLKEATLLSCVHQFQQVTDWHHQHPRNWA
ncbi:MAG: Asp-tRNA(Asn)/Glu-tRNA(Gln) amidotransferase subunit GatA [Pseudomonadales bacterium]